MKRLAIALLAAFSLTACADQFDTFGEDLRDVRVDTRNDEPASIIQMPNGYSNVAYKCEGTTMIYSSSNGKTVTAGRSIAVVPEHPDCLR